MSHGCLILSPPNSRLDGWPQLHQDGNRPSCSISGGETAAQMLPTGRVRVSRRLLQRHLVLEHLHFGFGQANTSPSHGHTGSVVLNKKNLLHEGIEYSPRRIL